MSILTVSEARENVDTALDDAALQRILDAEDEDIIYHYGEVGSQTERFDTDEHVKVIYPRRRVDSVTSIREIWPERNQEQTLEANDYVVQPSGMRIDRLPTGDHPRTYWGEVVEVVYTPYDDTKRRKAVLIDLVKLALAWGGVDGESLPDYSYRRNREYQVQRQEIMRRLGGRWWA
jgi:hypothetical protein